MGKIREKCIGNCGREVLVKLGAECRKCRRKRLHAGLKRIKKVQRESKLTAEADEANGKE